MSSIVPTRTGIANLPLHYGKVPPWLFAEAILYEILDANVARIGDKKSGFTLLQPK